MADTKVFEVHATEVIERTFRIEASNKVAARKIFEVTALADLFEVDEQVTSRQVTVIREATYICPECGFDCGKNWVNCGGAEDGHCPECGHVFPD